MTEQKFKEVVGNLSAEIIGSPFENHVFVVGGAVRDFVLKRPINDIDIVINMPMGGIAFAEWLTRNKIRYKYDERFRILDGYAIRPDFYLPEFDVYIEYWGMDTIDYKIGMFKKKKVYQMTAKKLISLYPDDCRNLDCVMREKLSRYISLQ